MALQLPPGSATIKLSIIDCGTRIEHVKTGIFVEPDIPALPYFHSFPALCFLLERENGERYIWDLGVREDFHNTPAKMAARIASTGWTTNIKGDVAGQLSKDGVPLESIKGVIWSHWHFDHSGDPSTFPPSTKLVVGPGTKEKLLPGYPTNPDSDLDEAIIAGRELEQVEFGTDRIGLYPSVDYFGDGSLFLLDSPGHAIGHISALIRTTPDTFVLLAGDTCHHGAHFRPNSLLPLTKAACPGHDLERLTDIHPRHSLDDPFWTYPNVPDGKGATYRRDPSIETRLKMQHLDADPNVLVALAHDETLLDVLPVYPHTLNAWKEKGWKDELTWLFLDQFKSVDES